MRRVSDVETVQVLRPGALEKEIASLASTESEAQRFRIVQETIRKLVVREARPGRSADGAVLKLPHGRVLSADITALQRTFRHVLARRRPVRRWQPHIDEFPRQLWIAQARLAAVRRVVFDARRPGLARIWPVDFGAFVLLTAAPASNRPAFAGSTFLLRQSIGPVAKSSKMARRDRSQGRPRSTASHPSVNLDAVVPPGCLPIPAFTRHPSSMESGGLALGSGRVALLQARYAFAKVLVVMSALSPPQARAARVAMGDSRQTLVIEELELECKRVRG